jgi:hypothetical protein
MEINFEFNFWGNIFAIISIIVSSTVAFWIYKLTKQLSAKDKFQHEKRITEEIRKLPIYKSVILADVSKYHPLRSDDTNETYYKQGAELYTVVPEYGVRVILLPSDENIPVALIPFEWIEYIRQDGDSEDSKPIIVCKFKGIRWFKRFKRFKRFKSPFREISYVYKNSKYKENVDPEFCKFTPIKPNSTSEN